MATSIALKAGMVPLTTLHISQHSLSDIQQTLAAKKAEAPALFQHLPCVLDLSGLHFEAGFLAQLLAICKGNGLQPIAVRNAAAPWREELEQLELADLGKGSSRDIKTPAQSENSRPVRVHTSNVRSGQQVFHDGDLIIFGMVSAGAEVLATGDIHIYGALRGRALAGVKGDLNAVIACQQFDAELVSIAGQFKVFETATEHHQHPAAISLQDGTLNITSV